MKRLVDESTDELTRSLLAAGIEHRPPPGNKATVIVALGAGGALGLFSSNALAWLGTTAGKVTAVGAAVGIAGAVFVAVPALRGDSGERAGATAASRAAASSVTARAESEVTEKAGAEAAGAVVPRSQVAGGPVPGNPSGGNPSAGNLSAGNLSAGSPATPGAGEAPLALDEQTMGEPTSGQGEPGSAQRAVAGGSMTEGGAVEGGSAIDGLVEAAPADARKSARSSVRAASKKRHLARESRSGKRKLAASERAEVQASEASGTAAVAGTSTDKDRLDAEVRLIDDMHWAARRNDLAALARSVQLYRESFPDGQLKAEAAEFAARLERNDAP